MIRLQFGPLEQNDHTETIVSTDIINNDTPITEYDHKIFMVVQRLAPTSICQDICQDIYMCIILRIGSYP